MVPFGMATRVDKKGNNPVRVAWSRTNRHLEATLRFLSSERSGKPRWQIPSEAALQKGEGAAGAGGTVLQEGTRETDHN